VLEVLKSSAEVQGAEGRCCAPPGIGRAVADSVGAKTFQELYAWQLSAELRGARFDRRGIRPTRPSRVPPIPDDGPGRGARSSEFAHRLGKAAAGIWWSAEKDWTARPLTPFVWLLGCVRRSS